MLSVPYALAAAGSAVDQGYPCATAPGGTNTGGTPGTTGTEQCTTTETTTTQVTTTTAPVASTPTTSVAAVQQTQQVAGAKHTVQRAATPHAASNVAPATAGTLPFTGVQLGVFVVIGLLLIGGGLVLRASGRRSSI